MAYRKPKKQPEFADLKGILSQSKKTDNALYQTVQEIIERLTQLKIVLNDDIAAKLSDPDAALKFASKFASFLTKDDDTPILPNSIQLLAGTNITFDDSVPNKRTINATGGGGLGTGYYAPLSDGDVDEMHLISMLGECIMVWVPTP